MSRPSNVERLTTAAADYERSFGLPPLSVVDFIIALESEGWGFVLPKDTPGICGRCRNFVEEGTRHGMFNGNQMFACEVFPIESGD